MRPKFGRGGHTVHEIDFRDADRPTARAKPFGAVALILFRALADDGRAPRDAAAFAGQFTRTPARVAYASADGGRTATYFGRWVTLRGELGPWSQGASLRVAA